MSVIILACVIVECSLLSNKKKDTFNYYSELFELKRPDGTDFFHTISIGLACDACMQNGLICTHKMDKLPAWKPRERQAVINDILKNYPELAATEILGMVKGCKRNAFERMWIHALRDRAPYKFEHNPNVLWMSVDPSGGGAHSDFALCTLAYANGKHVVLLFITFDTHFASCTPILVTSSTESILCRCACTCLHGDAIHGDEKRCLAATCA